MAIAVPLAICGVIFLAALLFCARSKVFRGPKAAGNGNEGGLGGPAPDAEKGAAVTVLEADWRAVIKRKMSESSNAQSRLGGTGGQNGVTVTERVGEAELPTLGYGWRSSSRSNRQEDLERGRTYTSDNSCRDRDRDRDSATDRGGRYHHDPDLRDSLGSNFPPIWGRKRVMYPEGNYTSMPDLPMYMGHSRSSDRSRDSQGYRRDDRPASCTSSRSGRRDLDRDDYYSTSRRSRDSVGGIDLCDCGDCGPRRSSNSGCEPEYDTRHLRRWNRERSRQSGTNRPIHPTRYGLGSHAENEPSRSQYGGDQYLSRPRRPVPPSRGTSSNSAETIIYNPHPPSLSPAPMNARFSGSGSGFGRPLPEPIIRTLSSGTHSTSTSRSGISAARMAGPGMKAKHRQGQGYGDMPGSGSSLGLGLGMRMMPHQSGVLERGYSSASSVGLEHDATRGVRGGRGGRGAGDGMGELYETLARAIGTPRVG